MAHLNVLPLSNEDAGLLVTRRSPQDDQLYRQRGGGLAHQEQCGQEEGRAGARWKCRRHRAQRCRSRYAAERCVAGGFSYAGQTCISVQRILVERSVFDKFIGLVACRSQEAEDWRSAG